MKHVSAGSVALRMVLRLQGLQPLEVVAAVLCCLSLLAWMWVVPQLQARVMAHQNLLAAQRSTLARLSAVQSAPVASQSENNPF